MPEIIVALDGMTIERATHLADQLRGMVWGFKANDLMDGYGATAVEALSKYGPVMADAKCHDIPNTVRNRVRRLVDAGAKIITVHASGGSEMVQAAVEEASEDCRIAAVTVLTGISEVDLRIVYQASDRKELYNRLTLTALRGRANTIVCGADFTTDIPVRKIVPGIRPAGTSKDDQKVTVSLISQLDCEFVVIGRPITQAEDPIAAVEDIKGG